MLREDIKSLSVYDEAFELSNIQKPLRNPTNKSALHLYVVRVDQEQHNRIFHSLRKKGIGVNLHYIPVHTHPLL